MSWVHNASGVLAGIVGAGAVIFVTESIGHSLGRGDDIFFFAIAGYFLGAAAGTAIARRLAAPRCVWLVPVLLAALATMNLFSLAHPPWFAPAGALVLVLGWFVGSRWPTRSTPSGRAL